MKIEEAKNILREFIEMDRSLREGADEDEYSDFLETKCVAIETLIEYCDMLEGM